MTSYAMLALCLQNWFLQFLEETKMIQVIQCSGFLSYMK